jgi:hypothetical protein
MALQVMLSRLGKSVVAVVPDELPESYKFLIGSDKIRTELGEDGDFVISVMTDNAQVDRVKYKMNENSVDILVSPKNGQFSPSDVTFRQSAGNFDAIVVIESDGLEQLGSVFIDNTALFADTPIVNLATSPNNEHFGRLNIVDSGASSVCEILFDRFQAETSWKEQFDQDMATILLSGIVSATGSFLEPNTTAHSLEIASQLQEAKAQQSDIIEHLFKMKSLPTLKSWGRILSNLKLDITHKLAWSGVSQADFEIAEASPSDVGDLSTMLLRHTHGADVLALFLDTEDGAQIQLRSDHPQISFSELNKVLGGKGEFVPSGLDFLISGKTVLEVESQFLDLLAQWQKDRLNISPDVSREVLDLKPAEAKPENPFPLHHDQVQEVKLAPVAPENLPFEAPLQPHEKTENVGGAKKKQEDTLLKEVEIDEVAEEKKQPKQSGGIPDWLRK